MRLAPLFFIAQLILAQSWSIQTSGTSASLRGVGVVSGDVAWASGTGGTWLRTIDGGKTWQSATVPGAEKLDFRGVAAFDANRAILMSSGEGESSTLYSTGDAGKTWTLSFHNPDPKGFFDAIAFDRNDVKYGALLGDPVDGMFALFLTSDGGRTWERQKLPPALTGEGAFAASNSSLVIRGCKDGACDIWFGTGGIKAARIFHGAGKWSVHETNVRNDAAGAGIFSIAPGPRDELVMVGGDYGKPRENSRNAGVWSGLKFAGPPATPPRGYRSSLVYLTDIKTWLTTGPTGSEYTNEPGGDWKPFDDGAFHAIGGVSSGACWAVGPKGRIARLTREVRSN